MFGMRPKVEERLAARALRVKGWPLRRIAEELGVSLGSVSLWTRDVNRLRPLRTIRLPVISGALRVCPRCERLQPIELFSRSGRDGRQHWCKDCFRDYFRARGDTHRTQVAAAKERRRGLARALVLEYLAERSCADCEEARARRSRVRPRLPAEDREHLRPGCHRGLGGAGRGRARKVRGRLRQLSQAADRTAAGVRTGRPSAAGSQPGSAAPGSKPGLCGLSPGALAMRRLRRGGLCGARV